MKKKFSKAEKTIIALVDENEYTTYVCFEHGVFQQRNDVANGICPYCKKVCEKLDNVSELREQFKKELCFS